MLTTRSFSRFRKISANRFPCDTHIRHNEVFIEGICKEIEILNNNTKKKQITEFKQWVDSLENFIPYWVATFRPKRM